MRRIMFAKRFARSERGSALAELAILVPFLIIMAASVAELGRLFQSYTTLSKSTRAAARYLSAKTYADNIQPARNIALCGKTDCTGAEPVVKGLQLANIVVDPEWKNGVAGGTLIRVTVRVDGYNFQPMFNLAAMLNMERYSSLPVKPSTTMYYMLTDTASAEGE
jgi:Flp pilus assembly protein TadG